MNTTDKLLLSRLTKQAGLGDVAERAGYWVPGVGAGLYGRDAAKAFSQGRHWAGIGNTLMAGVNLIPGLGLLSGAAKGLRLGGKLLGMTAKSSPLLTKGYKATLGAESALQRPGGWALNKIPGGKAIVNNPGTSTVGGLGAGAVAHNFQAKVDSERANGAQMANFLRGLPSQMAGMNPLGRETNPMFMRPGGG